VRATGRLIAASAALVTVLGWAQGSANAQAAYGQNDSTSIGAGAVSPGGPAVTPVSLGGDTTAGGSPTAGGSRGGGSSTPSYYTYNRQYLYGPCEPIPGVPDPGRLYRDMRTDTRTGETVEVGGGCERQSTPEPGAPASGGGAPPPPNPGALAVQALNRTPLPQPAIAMAPGGDIPLLVNLPTFLWIDPAQWRPVSASASAGGVTSTVTAVPQRVIWNMGQGDTVTCDGPGEPYVPSLPDDAQPSECQFTYPASSARSPDKTFTVTATVEWHVTWSASGAAGGGDLGISRRASTTTVQVAEIQVLNTAARS